MNRRSFFPILGLAAAAQPPAASQTLRGKLTATGAGQPALEAPGRGLVALEGDQPTLGVVKDPRLAGADFEAAGQFKSDRVFQIGPIHTRSMFLHRDGKRLFITYWCDLCAIRTYTPGICWCCQQDTKLDPLEKDDR
ncbi:MAG: hypothetical protein HY822_08945 [Acidobacteria bacterium]|nr:hypothetical protein [Acidobacteriota bacterium]